jgi:hypothetical protein
MRASTTKRMLGAAAVAGTLLIAAPAARMENKAVAADFLLRPKDSVVFLAETGAQSWWKPKSKEKVRARARVLVKSADSLFVTVEPFFKDGTITPAIKIARESVGQDATALNISFDLEQTDPLEGWLVFRKQGSDIQTMDFTVKRFVRAGSLEQPFIFGSGLAALLFVFRHWTFRRKFKTAGRPGPFLTTQLRTGDTKWDFSES